MEIKVFTAFSGYDSQCMALEKAGIKYDLVGWSEIDKFAIQAHNALFPQFKDRNFGDICPTLTASASDCILRFEGYKDGKPLIRRLTEREIFRLMGVNDDHISMIQDQGIGSRQQRKLAGNSICVNVLEGVFREMFN